jgi:hypothetical protein
MTPLFCDDELAELLGSLEVGGGDEVDRTIDPGVPGAEECSWRRVAHVGRRMPSGILSGRTRGERPVAGDVGRARR